MMLNRVARFIVFSFFAAATLPILAAQSTPAPTREQLLNGLPILHSYQPGDSRIFLKLRINSGAAFDLAGREGMMQLLSDAMFPDPTTRQYVEEELDGRLEVTTTYDTIDITLTGRAVDFERLAGLLRNAVVNLRLVNEEVTRLRDERLKRTKELSATATWQADRAIFSRLYGMYPYGRLAAGTPESLARAERADLLLSRDRFILPNNSTLVVIGGVDRPRALRAFRQLLGSWRKGDAIVPASFRQPELIPARTLLVAQPAATTAEVRLAVRGLSRADRDQTAAHLLTAVTATRWQAALGSAPAQSATARHDAHSLGGLFLLSASVPVNAAPKAVEAARDILKMLAASPITAAELEQARQSAFSEINRRRTQSLTDYLADQWLDAATYNLPAGYDESQAINSVTAADMQRVAARLFANQPPASVVVGDAAQLHENLAKLAGGIEVSPAPGAQAGPLPSPEPVASPAPAKQRP